ncbi:rCG30388 [Rattus norvegicus]|uniref:RCG30388 n=1 Tax=Rattus norvegicus TaxID=10116 RepID=A6JFQ5_RAT|nr:rCG30388 [Rattus norvegicus]
MTHETTKQSELFFELIYFWHLITEMNRSQRSGQNMQSHTVVKKHRSGG